MPDFFDNNGDQGNIEALKAHLSAVGIGFEVSSVISASDFVLIGDSSIAAHEHFSLTWANFGDLWDASCV